MTIVIQQAQHNAGTYRTAAAATDVLPNGTITASVIMDLADMKDPTLTQVFGIEGNDTPGAAAGDPGWYIVSQTDWQGNATGYNPKFPGVWQPPSVSWSSSTVAAQVMRATLTINKRTPVGLDVAVAAPSIKSFAGEAAAAAEISPKLARHWKTWHRVK